MKPVVRLHYYYGTLVTSHVAALANAIAIVELGSARTNMLGRKEGRSKRLQGFPMNHSRIMSHHSPSAIEVQRVAGKMPKRLRAKHKTEVKTRDKRLAAWIPRAASAAPTASQWSARQSVRGQQRR